MDGGSSWLILKSAKGLIEDTRVAVDYVIEVAGRAVIETVLRMSVENLTGPPHPGKHAGEIVRFGSQRGTVTLSKRKLRIISHNPNKERRWAERKF
jgi:hypothetical protein